ncbi:Chromatin assembly factor 1, subunit A [Cichlidogyrus casuarinus]|uniref:Chromatin assembly factor 1, subunit A n=1 Tax=Cichlidogyrus casuarinus TaxID=1844966 RepID=A0ABD2PNT2_9PLAT
MHGNKLAKRKLLFEFRCFWHKHTTGRLPKYLNLKEHTLSQRNKESEMDYLPFNYKQLVQKLAEIGSFTHESMCFRVNEKELQQYLPLIKQLYPESTDYDDLAKDWKYITDVANPRIKAAKEIPQEAAPTETDNTSARKRGNSLMSSFFSPKSKKQRVEARE